MSALSRRRFLGGLVAAPVVAPVAVKAALATELVPAAAPARLVEQWPMTEPMVANVGRFTGLTCTTSYVHTLVSPSRTRRRS